MTEDGQKNPDKEIIELSEIVVGTSPDDDAVIEMTEGLVSEARNAISWATGDNQEDTRQVDLTDESGFNDALAALDTEIIDLVEEVDASKNSVESDDSDEPEMSARKISDPEVSDLEMPEEMPVDLQDPQESSAGPEPLGPGVQAPDPSEEILELTEEVEPPADEARTDARSNFHEVEAITEQQLQKALERVVERRYGSMIDQILREMIWQKVSEDIDHLKQYLMTRNPGQ